MSYNFTVSADIPFMREELFNFNLMFSKHPTSLSFIYQNSVKNIIKTEMFQMVSLNIPATRGALVNGAY